MPVVITGTATMQPQGSSSFHVPHLLPTPLPFFPSRHSAACRFAVFFAVAANRDSPTFILFLIASIVARDNRTNRTISFRFIKIRPLLATPASRSSRSAVNQSDIRVLDSGLSGRANRDQWTTRKGSHNTELNGKSWTKFGIFREGL